MECHRTKGILHVMQILGHRNIKNTLIYTQYIVNQSQLIEAGFEYVCDIDGVKLFRKRK